MSRNAIMAIVAVAVALVVALVGWQLMGRGGDTVEGVEEIETLLKDIPQKGSVLGKDDAPVTVIEYIDFKCPACASASQGVVPTIIERYVREGRVKIDLRPVAILGPDSEIGALGALSAGNQDKAWTFAEVLFRNQGNETRQWITEELITNIARDIGLDQERFTADFSGTALLEPFKENQTRAARDATGGTPTFVIVAPDGTRETITGAAAEPVIQGIDAALAKEGKK